MLIVSILAPTRPWTATNEVTKEKTIPSIQFAIDFKDLLNFSSFTVSLRFPTKVNTNVA